jgi:hypothetical protein
MSVVKELKNPIIEKMRERLRNSDTRNKDSEMDEWYDKLKNDDVIRKYAQRFGDAAVSLMIVEAVANINNKLDGVIQALQGDN